MQRYLNKYTAIFMLTILAVLFTLPNVTNAGSISLPPNNLGLVGYWSMEDGGGTTATDFSGSGNTGTLTNMDNSDWVYGKFGKALEFDGVDDYVEMGDIDQAKGLSEITVSAWVKTSQVSSDASIIQKGPIGGTAPWLLFQDDVGGISGRTNVFTFAVTNGTDLTRVESSTNSAVTGSWVNVVGVWKQSPESIQMYINGSLNNQDTLLSSVIMQSNTLPVRIGYDSNNQFPFNGSIDDVRIYNRALSATEISNLYSRSKHTKIQSGVSNEGLVGYWSMEGTQDTSVDDYSGNGNTGTMTNMDTGTDYVTGYKAGSTALDFDGVGDYVDVSGTLDSSVWTVTFWAKPTQVNDVNWVTDDTYATNGIFLKGSSSAHVGMRVYYNGSEHYWNGGGNTVSVPFSSIVNEWHFYQFYSDGTRWYLYIDGQNKGYITPSTTRHVINYISSIRVNHSFSGELDDIRIYNRALSATEIGKLYNQTKSTKINTSQNNKITDGLVGLWSFNGQDISGTTAFDRSGQGNNGTLTNGPQPTAGKIGQGMSFDGVDDYVNIPLAALGNNSSEFSYSAWVKSDISSPNQRAIVSQYTNSLGYSLFTSSGKFYLYEGLSGGWDLTSSTAISAGTWYNVVVTFTPTYMYMYINGALEDSHTRTGTMPFSGSTYTTIGAVDPTRFYWDGVIDDVRIYNRALSTKEIQQLYGQGRTR